MEKKSSQKKQKKKPNIIDLMATKDELLMAHVARDNETNDKTWFSRGR